MKYIFFLILLFVTSSFNDGKEDGLIFKRINYIFTLKENLGEQVWPQFNNRDFELPLIYFTDSSSYIANPTSKFLSNHSSALVYENKRAKIYKTKRRIDQIAFHMETGMELRDKRAFNYRHPFMMCSGVEEAQRKIKELESTEEWASFVLHEFFHGFQFMHKPFFKFYSEAVFPFNKDSLQNVYEKNPAYERLINKENELLLVFLEGKNKNDVTYLTEFLNARKARRSLLRKIHSDKFIEAEKFFETLEGTARYVEFNLLRSFKDIPSDNLLKATDPLYKGNREFEKFNQSNQPWLYKTQKSGAYFYATGFNICMALDKLNVLYKDKLFNSGSASLEDILADELKNL